MPVRSSAPWSAGVSTTASWRGSRPGSRQMLHTVASVKVWQRSQWRTFVTAAVNASAMRRAPSRSCCSRWYVIR